MSIKAAIFSILSNDAGVAALVTARIYPAQAPQRVTAPFITYRRISGPRDHTLSGPTGLTRPRFEFSCWATTDDGAEALAAAVRAALANYSGTVVGVVIHYTKIDGERDLPFESSLQFYRVAVDVIISHDE